MILMLNCTRGAILLSVSFSESRITATSPLVSTNWLFALRISFYLLLLLYTFNLPTTPNFMTKSKCCLRKERKERKRATFGSSPSLQEMIPTYSSGTPLKSRARKVSPFCSAAFYVFWAFGDNNAAIKVPSRLIYSKCLTADIFAEIRFFIRLDTEMIHRHEKFPSFLKSTAGSRNVVTGKSFPPKIAYNASFCLSNICEVTIRRVLRPLSPLKIDFVAHCFAQFFGHSMTTTFLCVIISSVSVYTTVK